MYESDELEDKSPSELRIIASHYEEMIDCMRERILDIDVLLSRRTDAAVEQTR